MSIRIKLRHGTDFLSDRDIRITVINILRDPRERIHNEQEYKGKRSIDMETLKESKGNTRNQNHSVGLKKCQ